MVDVLRANEPHQFAMTVVRYAVLQPSFFGPALGVILLAFGLYVFFKSPKTQVPSFTLALIPAFCAPRPFESPPEPGLSATALSCCGGLA